MDTYVYSIEEDTCCPDTLYVNLTNKCTNNCVFCIRKCTDEIKGKSLWLKDKSISLDKIVEQFEKFKTPKEIVFCGYGEPLLELNLLIDFAKYIKENYNIKIRINTNGHANFIYKKNVINDLKGIVDEISISLNAS